MIRDGIVGDRSADGWVEWTTCDSFWSYNPAVACGSFIIVLGRGVVWGAIDDEHGVATIADITEGASEAADSEYSFPWCMAGIERAVADIAERCGHPAVENVVAAARELWLALMQEGAGV